MTAVPPPASLIAWRVVAVAMVLVSVAATVASIWLDSVTLEQLAGDPSYAGSAWSAAVAGLVLVVPGALLVWQVGGHPVAIVLTIFGALWALDGPAIGVVNLALVTGEDSALASWGFWYFARFGSILLLPIQVILLLFPDGRLATGAWRIVSIVSLALASLLPITFILQPAKNLGGGIAVREEQLARFDPGFLAIPLPDAVWATLSTIAQPSAAIASILAIAVTISRRRGASFERRAQLRWLIWAGLVFVALLVVSSFLPVIVQEFAFTIGLGFVSVSILIAVTRHGLYTVDRLLSWTLVYALLIASVLLVDVGIYLLVGAIFDDRVTMLVALLIVVVAYAPLRDRLFRAASRLVNGRRDDPYAVVSELAGRLEQAGGTRDQLTELARSIASAFASGFVRVELDRPDGTVITSEVGTPAAHTASLPLEHDGKHIGRILMQEGRRPAISPRDRRLLSDLVRLAAAAILNAELNRELQAIREGLVTAREEERSRLRRELHDGLGPLLGGIRLRLETSRNLIEKQPEKSLSVLDTAIDESSEVIAEIRRLVHDLRPPALDDLGLARAVEQQADRLSGGDLAISVSVPSPIEPLSAAVEVAAYRIASEALTNVVKHAGATAAVVRLIRTDAALVVEIEDDGIGISATSVAGVGTVSLRSRATELGGSVELSEAQPGADRPGVLVRATLPLPVPAAEDATP
ncbi:histidine kinase [Antiquaquibacter oligotrophicus]|nr:histidine kinase [Antiquaquibacter oligotrophicus]UDF12400.1 histidine kinase [Antiquaquibacter oligotrophicus]